MPERPNWRGQLRRALGLQAESESTHSTLMLTVERRADRCCPGSSAESGPATSPFPWVEASANNTVWVGFQLLVGSLAKE